MDCFVSFGKDIFFGLSFNLFPFFFLYLRKAIIFHDMVFVFAFEFFQDVVQEASGNKLDNAYILAFSQCIFVAFPQNHYF